MKKRLLITSIVMMLVVAVALSTATYAWFTSNTTVTADAVLLTASTMAEDAILISHAANNTDTTQAITLTAQGTDRLYPATPIDNTMFSTNFASLGEEDFKNLLIDGTNTANDTSITSVNKSYYSDTFYIYNKGFSAVTIAPTVNITYGTTGAEGDAARSVRIAIIEKKGTQVSTGNIEFGAATLKNIYEFSSETVNTISDSNPGSFDNTKVYANAEKEIQTVTAENFETLQSTIYEVTGYKSVATAAALNVYGVTGEGPYTQGSLTFTNSAFQSIAAADSGYYVANQYTVVVWYEGWDAQCTNAMSAGAIRVDLSFQKA